MKLSKESGGVVNACMNCFLSDDVHDVVCDVVCDVLCMMLYVVVGVDGGGRLFLKGVQIACIGL